MPAKIGVSFARSECERFHVPNTDAFSGTARHITRTLERKLFPTTRRCSYNSPNEKFTDLHGDTMHSYADAMHMRTTELGFRWTPVCEWKHYIFIRISTGKNNTGWIRWSAQPKVCWRHHDSFTWPVTQCIYYFLDKISIFIQFAWTTWRPQGWNFIAWRFVKNFARPCSQLLRLLFEVDFIWKYNHRVDNKTELSKDWRCLHCWKLLCICIWMIRRAFIWIFLAFFLTPALLSVGIHITAYLCAEFVC